MYKFLYSNFLSLTNLYELEIVSHFDSTEQKFLAGDKIFIENLPFYLKDSSVG